MRGKVKTNKNPILPDLKHNSLVVSKMINYIMKSGKKSVAEKIVYGALDIIAKKTKKSPAEALDIAIKNVSPSVEVKSRRVGGASYQIPVEVRSNRKLFLAFNWLVGAAQGKKGKPMKEKLAEEILLALNNEGVAIKKKNDVHRMAEANKAFAHFAWR